MRNISISCMQMFINIISREYISASQNPFRPFMSFPEKNVCYHICLNVVNFCLGYFCQHYLYVIIYKEKSLYYDNNFSVFHYVLRSWKTNDSWKSKLNIVTTFHFLDNPCNALHIFYRIDIACQVIGVCMYDNRSDFFLIVL